jgi:transposase
MAMGRKDRERQDTMWIAASDIARSEGHVFYRALNRLFQRHGFDTFVEDLVQKSGIFVNGVGRPSVAPGVYFRMSGTSKGSRRSEGSPGDAPTPCR